MEKQANQLDQTEVEKVSFAGLYFLIIGFLWQMMWQFNKVIDYHKMVRIPKEVFYWGSIVLISLVITYLLGYMVYLETKKKIDSKGLFIKYSVGLLLGYVVAKILIGTV